MRRHELPIAKSLIFRKINLSKPYWNAVLSSLRRLSAHLSHVIASLGKLLELSVTLMLRSCILNVVHRLNSYIVIVKHCQVSYFVVFREHRRWNR